MIRNPGFRFAHPGYSQTRVIAPCFVRLQGPPVVLVPFSPKGRAERQGVSPRPRRHVPEHMAPCARKAHGKHSHGSSNTPAFRTRMDFAACCMSQGLSLAPTRPRSCELSPGHALGPSARLAGVCPRPLSKDRRSSQRPRVRHRSGHRIPLRVSKTIATRPLPERDGRQIFLTAKQSQSPQEQSPRYLFSENQKSGPQDWSIVG